MPEKEGFQDTIRIPANDLLMASINHPLPGQWDALRINPRCSTRASRIGHRVAITLGRVVVKVEWHFDGLFPRAGFIVTNMTGWSRKVEKFYNGRGTAEQWIKEGKYAANWTRMSCRNFTYNQAGLQLLALAYNLGTRLWRLVLPRSMKHWSLTTLREKLTRSEERWSGIPST